MDNFSGIQFQELKFLNELLDQVIILEKKKNICCSNISAQKRFGSDLEGKNISVWFETIISLKQLIKPSRLIKLTL